MSPWSILLRQWLLSLFYVAAATLAIALTRLEGGVAQLWGATAILTAALLCTATRHWWAPVFACLLPSVLVTGMLGLGWKAAIPFAFINGGEALVAAWLLRRFVAQDGSVGSLQSAATFVFCSVAAAFAVAPVVAATLLWLGQDLGSGLLYFVIGHSLGLLTFLPLAMMLTGGRRRRELLAKLRHQKSDTLAVITMSLATSLLVFAQTEVPLMYLASLAAVIAAFRLGQEGAAISFAILAMVGATATSLGTGALMLVDVSASQRLLMFQFYLATTVLTIFPVAAHLDARKAMLKQLRDSEARFRMLAEQTSDILMQLGPKGEFRYVSPSVRQLGGYDHQLLVGRTSAEFIHPDDLADVAREHRACFATPSLTRRYRHRAIIADGSIRWVEAHACAQLDETGTPDSVISLLRDVTDEKQVQEKWQAAALTDALTGLPNRRALERLVERMRPGEHCLALLDIDRFKQVNDTYGHDAGDAVLKGFADVARRLVRTNDTVARLGGEEFVILFEHTSLEQAYQVCDRMRRLVGRTLLATPSGPLRVTASGGVSPIGRKGLEVALKAADEALYRAKKNGRDQLLLAA